METAGTRGQAKHSSTPLSWDAWLLRLKAFHRGHGHFEVPAEGEHRSLNRWVRAQRYQRRAGILSEERKAALAEIGFWPTPQVELRWMENYRRLEAYVSEHGHADVPKEDPDHGLAVWVHNQRRRRRGQCDSAPLTDEQTALLDKLGFRWEPRDEAWEAQYTRLQQFKASYGHTEVPANWASDPMLGRWAKVQRAWYRDGKLSQERIDRLRQLEFRMEPRSRHRATWEQRLRELAAFKAAHGHCDVPRVYPANRSFGYFVHDVRRACKQGRLSAERIAQLDQLGFSWHVRPGAPRQPTSSSVRPSKVHGETDTEAYWQDRLKELLAYRQLHGHCDVPASWSVNRSLARWVRDQRRARQVGSLSPERIGSLEEAGFVWG